MALLRPLFKYYGSKFRAARHYPAPMCDTIVEPFAGAAGYSCRYPEKQVVLYDLDPHICGVWDYLIHASGEEIRRLPVFGPTDTVDDIDAPPEAKWLIGFWLNAGASSPCKTPSAWMRQCFWPETYPATGRLPGSPQAIFWSAANRDRIAAEVEKIRHWEIRQASYEQGPGITATWFVDPPYQGAGKHYRHGSRGLDYTLLGLWCRSLDGQVLVCENAGADWLPFEPFRTIKGTSGSGRSGKSIEVLWRQETGQPARSVAE